MYLKTIHSWETTTGNSSRRSQQTPDPIPGIPCPIGQLGSRLWLEREGGVDRQQQSAIASISNWVQCFFQPIIILSFNGQQERPESGRVPPPPSYHSPSHIEGIVRRRRAGAFLLCRLHIYAFSMNNFYAKSEQVAQFTLVKRDATRVQCSRRRSWSGQLLLYKSGLHLLGGCNRCREEEQERRG